MADVPQNSSEKALKVNKAWQEFEFPAFVDTYKADPVMNKLKKSVRPVKPLRFFYLHQHSRDLLMGAAIIT